MVWSKGQSAGTIGWRTNSLGLDIAIGVVSATFVLVAIAALSIFLFAMDPDLSRTEQTRKAIESTVPRMSIPATIATMFLVAVWEETLFRGFLLTRLHAIAKRWWLAIPIGAVIFASLHGYQGKLSMVLISGLGVVLGGLFVWRKSLVPCIVCHTLFNLVMMLLMRLAAPGWK
jgi:membrane protease YdiL (CAAX protease family)